MKVIIVDDERYARESLEIETRKIPRIKEIKLFGNTRDALCHAKENPVDVAFIDIEMPEMTGLELAMRLKNVNPKINMVFVTGYPQYAVDAFAKNASDYLLKPAAAERIEEALRRLRNPVPPLASRVRVQAFGNFEVFVEGKPLLFTYEKTKELLAYLVHRKGAVTNNNEILAVIYENKDDSPSLQSHFRNLVSDLTKTFKEAGLSDMIVKKYGSLGIMPDMFTCDYYDYLKGIPYAVNSYAGEYMAQYTWAEFTNAYLSN